MKGTHLGEFEEIVMLVIPVLMEDVYGLIMIKKELEVPAQHKVSISPAHAACNRLKIKIFLTAGFGGKSYKRGGKRNNNFLFPLFITRLGWNITIAIT